MKSPAQLTRDELIGLVALIQEVLWHDGRDFDPDKPWDADTIGEVGLAMERAGLAPDKYGDTPGLTEAPRPRKG